MARGFRDNKLVAKDVTVKNDLTIEGDLTFGDASTDTLTLNGKLLMSTNNQLQFRDTANYMYSSAVGRVDWITATSAYITSPSVLVTGTSIQVVTNLYNSTVLSSESITTATSPATPATVGIPPPLTSITISAFILCTSSAPTVSST